MGRGRRELVPFRDRFADMCREIAERAIVNSDDSEEAVWIPAEPMRAYCRSVQFAVESLVDCGALCTVEYTKALAWQCEAFRSVRQPASGRNYFYVVVNMAAIRSWAREQPALTQRSVREYLNQGSSAPRAAA